MKKRTDTCPFVARKCVREGCHAWITVWKTDQTTGAQEPQECCGLTYQTILLVEMLQTLRHAEARAHATANHTNETAKLLGAIMVRAGTARVREEPPKALQSE